MPEPDYGDFWKFLTSLGLVAIGVGLSTPFLILVLSKDILATEVHVYGGAATRQFLFDIIRLARWLFDSMFIICGLPFLLGIGLFVIGITRWRKKQKIDDEIQQRNFVQVQVRTEPGQIDQPAFSYVATGGFHLKGHAEATHSKPQENVLRADSRSLEVEKIVSDTFDVRLSAYYDLLRNRRSGAFEYDIIAVGRGKKSDVVIEVKYYKEFPTSNIVAGVVSRLVRSMHHYEENIRPLYCGLLVIAIEGSSLGRGTDERLHKLDSLTQAAESNDVGIIITSIAELSSEKFLDDTLLLFSVISQKRRRRRTLIST